MSPKHPYPDNIYGGINHPTKGAWYHREHALGIHHFSFHQPNPAVTGEPILSWVYTSADHAFEKVTASYTLDDWESTYYLEYQKANCMGSIHMRRFWNQVRVIMFNILSWREIVQCTMGTDIVIHPFPFSKFFIKFF